MTSPIPSFAPGDEGSSRRRQIMEIAARLFARKGYRGASMRDIGEQAGVLGGSLYHPTKSKDALFIELPNAALDVAEMRHDRKSGGSGRRVSVRVDRGGSRSL